MDDQDGTVIPNRPQFFLIGRFRTVLQALNAELYHNKGVMGYAANDNKGRST